MSCKKDSFCGRENLLIFIRNDLEDWARRLSDHSAEFVGNGNSRNLSIYVESPCDMDTRELISFSSGN